jgi:hypothetical protein
VREGFIEATKWIEALCATFRRQLWYLDGNRLLAKRAIFIASAVDTALLILLAILWPLTFSCSNSAASSQGTCTANQLLGGFGVALVWILAFVFTLLTIEVWLVSSIKMGRPRGWPWFVLCLIIPPIGLWLYGIFGPEESRSEPPFVRRRDAADPGDILLAHSTPRRSWQGRIIRMSIDSGLSRCSLAAEEEAAQPT